MVIALWLGIPILVGLATDYFLGLGFWVGFGVAIFSLNVNALIIEWEDRQPGGWGSDT
jgi:hypothetical protein